MINKLHEIAVKHRENKKVFWVALFLLGGSFFLIQIDLLALTTDTSKSFINDVLND